jgi:hypothetical protein
MSGARKRKAQATPTRSVSFREEATPTLVTNVLVKSAGTGVSPNVFALTNPYTMKYDFLVTFLPLDTWRSRLD